MQTYSSRSCYPGHIGSTSDARHEPWVLLSHACIASHGSREKGNMEGSREEGRERKRERGREKGNMEGSREEGRERKGEREHGGEQRGRESEEERERGKRNRKSTEHYPFDIIRQAMNMFDSYFFVGVAQHQCARPHPREV